MLGAARVACARCGDGISSPANDITNKTKTFMCSLFFHWQPLQIVFVYLKYLHILHVNLEIWDIQDFRNKIYIVFRRI